MNNNILYILQYLGNYFLRRRWLPSGCKQAVFNLLIFEYECKLSIDVIIDKLALHFAWNIWNLITVVQRDAKSTKEFARLFCALIEAIVRSISTYIPIAFQWSMNANPQIINKIVYQSKSLVHLSTCLLEWRNLKFKIDFVVSVDCQEVRSSRDVAFGKWVGRI